MDNADSKQPVTIDGKAEVKIEEPSQAAKGKNKKADPSKSSISLVALVLAILALLACCYLYWNSSQEVQQGQELQGNIDDAMEQLKQQSAVVADIKQLLSASHQDSLREEQLLQQQLNSIQLKQTDLQRQLQTLSTTDRADWLLAEAEYLMRLANQRVLMGSDVNSALDLLMAADEIMRELQDSTLYPIREQLANNIAALRTARQFDIEGLYFELASLAQQIDQLQLIQMQKFQLPVAESEPPETWQQRLEHGFTAALSRLGDYIQINRRDEKYKPVLSPDYEDVIRQNIRLMIEQAQSAVMSGRQTIYENSLNKARFWLTTYYTLDQQTTEAVVAIVDELATKKVSVTMPDISSSSRALKNYMETIRQHGDAKKSADKNNQQPLKESLSNDKVDS